MISSKLQYVIFSKNLLTASKYCQYYYTTIYVQYCLAPFLLQTSDAVLHKFFFAPKSTHARLSTNSRFFFLSLPKSNCIKKTAFPLLLLLYNPTIAKGYMFAIYTIVMRLKNKDNFYSHERLKTYILWQLIIVLV